MDYTNKLEVVMLLAKLSDAIEKFISDSAAEGFPALNEEELEALVSDCDGLANHLDHGGELPKAKVDEQKYKVLEFATVCGLELGVNNAIRQGWMLAGGVAVAVEGTAGDGHIYCQAMMRL